MQTYDVAEFLDRIAEPTLSGTFSVRIDGGEIPMRVNRRNSPTLIVTFAGAIDRSKLKLPQFGGAKLNERVPGTVIRIADPSLTRSPHITAAWYAGHEGFETQSILPDLIKQTAKQCQAERIIFVGGSVGGFAALHYSWREPGSIALVTNPQTNIERFAEWHQRNYRNYCRPHLALAESLSSVITSDLTTAYGNGFDNTVIYLQNATDASHVHNHFAPFLSRIDNAHQKKIIPRLGYWGRPGHGGIPAEEWLSWLKAAIASPAASAEAIQSTRMEYAAHCATERSEQEQRVAVDTRLAMVLAREARKSIQRAVKASETRCRE